MLIGYPGSHDLQEPDRPIKSQEWTMIHRVSRVSSNRFLGEISPSSGRKGECEYCLENLTGKSPGSSEASQGQGGQEAGKQSDRRQTDRQEKRASGSDSGYKSKLPNIDIAFFHGHENSTSQSQDSAWVGPSEIQNLSTEIVCSAWEMFAEHREPSIDPFVHLLMTSHARN